LKDLDVEFIESFYNLFYDLDLNNKHILNEEAEDNKGLELLEIAYFF